MIKEKSFNCCGCSACVVICPKNCLDINKTENGFFEPDLINDRCINCNLCEVVCPMLNNKNADNKSLPKSYSGYSINEETRRTCTSGGIGYEIAKNLIQKGYNICSVKYNKDNNIAEHFIIKTLYELEKSKGSKYIQSNCINAFKNIFDGNKYAVFGTPCQIAGIRKVAKLKKMEDNFIFIDLFCHGVPSYLLWESYLKYKKLRNINNVNFRDKVYGWHNYTLSISLEETTIYSDKDKDKDLFYQFFLGDKVLNKCCYECKFKLNNSDADIRIGDLWGEKYSKNTEGVSGILAFTNKGQNVLENLNCICIKEEMYSEVVEGQLKENLMIPKYRNKILKDLKNDKNLNIIYFKYIILIKIKNKVLRLLRGI